MNEPPDCPARVRATLTLHHGGRLERFPAAGTSQVYRQWRQGLYTVLYTDQQVSTRVGELLFQLFLMQREEEDQAMCMPSQGSDRPLKSEM